MVNFGQIICGLVATDPIVAQEAVDKIRVHYEELKPIITIEVGKIIIQLFLLNLSILYNNKGAL